MSENYQGNDRELSITISPITDFETFIYQKEDEPPEKYISNEVENYLVMNTNELSAVWNTENCNVLIVGNITPSEMKRIIDSIYEVKP